MLGVSKVACVFRGTAVTSWSTVDERMCSDFEPAGGKSIGIVIIDFEAIITTIVRLDHHAGSQQMALARVHLANLAPERAGGTFLFRAEPLSGSPCLSSATSLKL